jgi:hypothetical protein
LEPPRPCGCRPAFHPAGASLPGFIGGELRLRDLFHPGLPKNHDDSGGLLAPEAALMKLPATDGAMAAKTDPAPVLSPSQARCFSDCPARWWFNSRTDSNCPIGKTVRLLWAWLSHQALEVNFREKLANPGGPNLLGWVLSSTWRRAPHGLADRAAAAQNQ